MLDSISVIGCHFRDVGGEGLEKAKASVENLRINHCPGVSEWMTLSTCNRVEILFVVSGGLPMDTSSLHVASMVFPGIPLSAIRVNNGADAVAHYIKVASGLDSVVVGEPEILGQVKDAFQASEESGFVGPRLRSVMTEVIRSAKAIRTRTAIGEGRSSVASIAASIAAKHINGSGRGVAVMGAGTVGASVAKSLRASLPDAPLSLMVRNPEKVAELAEQLGADIIDINSIVENPPQMGAIVTALSTDFPFVTEEHIKALASVNETPVAWIDTGMPRNIDPEARTAAHADFYNMDDIATHSMHTAELRTKAEAQADEIIGNTMKVLEHRLSMQSLSPHFQAWQERYADACEDSLNYLFADNRIETLPEEMRDTIADWAQQLTYKLAKIQMSSMREFARDDACSRAGGCLGNMAAVMGKKVEVVN